MYFSVVPVAIFRVPDLSSRRSDSVSSKRARARRISSHAALSAPPGRGRIDALADVFQQRQPDRLR